MIVQLPCRLVIDEETDSVSRKSGLKCDNSAENDSEGFDRAALFRKKAFLLNDT
jgi:hypothetical protein